ncbi:hypothetical protein [Pseudomonas bohemica]|uniref:hypothetical protein n=1 Tax=Pseudomonas bohemica TaxID=2044872 RepID=UPI001F2C14D5|nr:hypothetical protein [Pseudomonas bohemica]
MNKQDGTAGTAPIPLEIPTVSVALEGGVIPVEHLISPVTVTLPVWPAAEAEYTYQLVFDGERIAPEKVISDTDQPGDLLNLEIPVSLLIEGVHAVAYRVYSPFSDSEVFSDPVWIEIDKTAPGAPDLAPIIFPSEIRDGLTSDELEAMNNVLPGRIASYNGMAQGDVVRTYRGELEGPLVTVDANDMGLNSVTVNFTRELLDQADGMSSQVYYTVTDLAGNVSMKSEALSIELQLSVLNPLPLPIIKEAINDILDPANAGDGATVMIDASATLREGELLSVRWEGPKGRDIKEHVVTAEEAGQQVSLVISSALVTVNDGQAVEVSYSVTRRSGVVQDSEKVAVKILSATLDLPAPTVDTVGPDGVLRPSLITGEEAIARASYRGMVAADEVQMRWVGKTTYESEAQTVGDSTHLKFGIPRQCIDDATGGSATVSYRVTREGAETDSHALDLTVREGLVLDTSPVALTGKVYLLPAYPNLLPAFPTGTTVKRAAAGGAPPYTYSSSDPKVAQVNEEGLTSVRGNGGATISVSDAAGESKSYTVSVTGVIECHGVGAGNLSQASAAASRIGGRIPSIQELIGIFNAYGNRWPMGNGNYWSSTVAKDLFGAKWYYVKNLNTGKDFKLLHINPSLCIALR